MAPTHRRHEGQESLARVLLVHGRIGEAGDTATIELFWIPLGADGNPAVRWGGRLCESIVARLERRHIAVLTEQQLISNGTADLVEEAVRAWREQIVSLLEAAAVDRDVDLGDLNALADHMFVTFEGAYLLCRSTGDPAHMRAQLGVLRRLIAASLGAG